MWCHTVLSEKCVGCLGQSIVVSYWTKLLICGLFWSINCGVILFKMKNVWGVLVNQLWCHTVLSEKCVGCLNQSIVVSYWTKLKIFGLFWSINCGVILY